MRAHGLDEPVEERRGRRYIDSAGIGARISPMRNLLIVVAASLVFAGQVAWSQVSPPIEAPTEAPLPPIANINLSLEQKHTIRELVKDMHLPKEGGKFDLKVGASVPASVVLAPVPVEIGNKVPQIKSHRLFVTGERIVLVNPNDPRIAEVIDEP
jgi:hypothetical protein